MLTIEVCPREPSAILSYHGEAADTSPHWFRIQAVCQSGDNEPAVRRMLADVPLSWRIIRATGLGSYANVEAADADIIATATALVPDRDEPFTAEDARLYCLWLACWAAIEESECVA